MPRPVLVACEHAIPHPDVAWPYLIAAVRRIAEHHEATTIRLLLSSPWDMELFELDDAYRFEIMWSSAKHLKEDWTVPWLDRLMRELCRHRIRDTWFAERMPKNQNLADWLVYGSVAVVVLKSVNNRRMHSNLFLAAQRLSVPHYRVDTESFGVFKMVEPTRKEDESNVSSNENV